jgi:hypothetical protein
VTTRVVVGALLAVSILHFAFVANAIRVKGFSDFPGFLWTAARFLETGQLYVSVDNLTAYDPRTPFYKYPPLFALFLLPLAQTNRPAAVALAFWVVQIALYLGTAGLAIRFLRDRLGAGFAVGAWILVLNFAPYFETLLGLQVETLLLLLLLVALLALARGHDVALGASLATAAMLKVYPAFLLAYVVARGRWRAVAAWVGSAMLLFGLCVLVFGWEANRVYFGRLLPYMAGESLVDLPRNVSAARLGKQLFGASPEQAKLLARAITIPLVGLSLLLVWRRRTAPPDSRLDGLGLAAFTALMLMCLTNSWANYQLLLLVPLLTLLGVAVAGGHRLGLAALACACVPLLFSENTFPVEGWQPLPQGLQALMIEARILPTIATWAAAILLLVQKPPR